MKVIRKICIGLLSALFVFSLAACGEKTDGLPKFDGTTESMTEERGIEKFEEITGGEFGYELKNYSGFTASGDYDKYVDYAEKCKNEGYVNQGEMSDKEVSATLFSSTEQDNVMLLVCYQAGQIYVLKFEVEGNMGPSEAIDVWPTAEEMAIFHVNLTEPSGIKIRSANLENAGTNAFVEYTTLDITLTECSASVYDSLKGQIEAAGYNLGRRDEQDSSSSTYMASMVKNGVEYSVDIHFIHDQEGALSISFENTTERYMSDYGVTAANVFSQATVGIKESGQAYRADENGGESLQHVENTTYFSFNSEYFLEWYGDRTGDNRDENKEPTLDGSQSDETVINGIEDYVTAGGAWLTEIGTDNQYNVVGDYKHKQEDNVNEQYTTATYAARRGLSVISGYYANALNLQKTGKTQIIAGKECAEYVGKSGIIDGEFISWDATFYVWEEYDLPMKYEGKQYWNGEQLDYVAEYVYFEQTSIADKYAAYPVQGEKIPFPAEKIAMESGLDIIPQVDGADGYSTEKTGVTVNGDENKQVTRFKAHGVTEDEFEAYKRAVISAGFTQTEGKLCYDLGNNTRVVMALEYTYGEDVANFYFYTEEYDPLSNPTLPTLADNALFVFKGEMGTERKIYALEFDGDNIYVSVYSSESYPSEYVYVKNGDTYEKFQGTKENIRNYTGSGTVGSYDSKEIVAAINGDFDSRLFFDGFDYMQKTGEEEVQGLNTAVYESEGSERVNISLDYGFVVKTEGGQDFALFLMEDSEFTSVFPALEDHKSMIVYGKESYLLKQYGMEMDTYLYLHECYAQIYQSYRRVEIHEDATLVYIQNYFNSIDRLEKADGFDDASVGKKYYVVYEDVFEQSDEYSYAFSRNVIITDGKNVMEINANYNQSQGDTENYVSGYMYITEFSLEETAKDYFGDEFQKDVKLSDYLAFGTVTVTVSEKVESDDSNMDNMPSLRPRTVTIDFDGRLVMNEWGEFFYFDSSTPTKGGMIYEDGDGKYVSYGSETTQTKEEYVAYSVGYTLAKKYDTSKMSKEKGEWLGRECVVYKGYYTYRGMQYELEIWEDVETDVNLYVKRQNETYNGAKSYTIYSIDSIEAGTGIGMTEEEFLALPQK